MVKYITYLVFVFATSAVNAKLITDYTYSELLRTYKNGDIDALSLLIYKDDLAGNSARRDKLFRILQKKILKNKSLYPNYFWLNKRSTVQDLNKWTSKIAFEEKRVSEFVPDISSIKIKTITTNRKLINQLVKAAKDIESNMPKYKDRVSFLVISTKKSPPSLTNLDSLTFNTVSEPAFKNKYLRDSYEGTKIQIEGQTIEVQNDIESILRIVFNGPGE